MTKSVYDVSQATSYQEVIYGSSVTPLPLLTHNAEYPPIKLEAVVNRKQATRAGFDKKNPFGPPPPGTVLTGRVTFGTPRAATILAPSSTTRGIDSVEFQQLEPSLREQVSGNVNWFSPYGNLPEDPNQPVPEDPNKPARPQNVVNAVDPNAPKVVLNFKAPSAMPPSSKALIRFVDADMDPGATYQYRVRARFANPNFEQPAGVVAHSGLAAMKQLVSSAWTETQTIYVPPDDARFFITHQDRNAGLVTKAQGPKAIDRQPNTAAGDKVVPFQVQRFADSFSFSLGKDAGKTFYVGDWMIAERLFVARGEPIGRECDVEAVVWDKWQSQWNVNGLPAKFDKKDQYSKKLQPVAVNYDFRVKPEVVLLDFTGGARVYINPRTKFESQQPEDSAVQALLLMPDMTMRLHNGQDDALAPERQEAFDAWRDRLETLSTPSAVPLKDKK